MVHDLEEAEFLVVDVEKLIKMHGLGTEMLTSSDRSLLIANIFRKDGKQALKHMKFNTVMFFGWREN